MTARILGVKHWSPIATIAFLNFRQHSDIDNTMRLASSRKFYQTQTPFTWLPLTTIKRDRFRYGH